MEKSPEENSKKEPWDWKGYYDLLKDKGQSKALDRAIRDYVKTKFFALDIGAGNLRDTKYLLSLGFKVVAIDPSPLSIKMAEEIKDTNLEMFGDIVGKYKFPENYFDLVNAQGILFHLPKKYFSIIIEKISQSLKLGGVLCANFIGEKDDWNVAEKDVTIMNREKLQEAFSCFEIVFLKESEEDETEEFAAKKGKNKPKHWHQFSVIAIKK